MSVRPRDSPVPRTDNGTPVSASHCVVPPPLSRTPSTNTITQSGTHIQHTPIRTGFQRPAPLNDTSTKRSDRTSTLPLKRNQSEPLEATLSDIATSSSTGSSSSDSDPDNPAHRSQLFKRPPRFRQQRPRELLTYHEKPDEGDGLGNSASETLPFARPLEESTSTLDDGKHRQQTARNTNPKQKQEIKKNSMDVSSSIASSISDGPKSSSAGGPSVTGLDPLSPRHRAELTKLNHQRVGSRPRKDGSEGTPSMGSSFSGKSQIRTLCCQYKVLV